MRKIISIMMIMLVLVGAVYAGGSSDKSASSQSQSGKTVVNIWTNDRHDAEYLNEKIAEFNASNQDIEIKMTTVVEDYPNMLVMSYTSGNAPDLFYMNARGTGFDLKTFVDAGMLVPYPESLLNDPDFEKVTDASKHIVEGINAITLAMKDIEWFSTYQFPEKSDLLGPVKMTVTIIHAGTQHNVVPDKCEFTVDIRSNEFYSNERLYDIIREHVGCEVKARSFRLSSSRTDREHPFVQRALMMGKEPFGSPTLSDQALMRFPSVKIGPGDSARSHSADEYIEAMEIREAIDTYIRLLNGLRL